VNPRRGIETLGPVTKGLRRAGFRARAAAAIVAVGALAPALAAAADFEVSGPDGRRILLKSDGTWRYLDVRRGDVPSARADRAEVKAIEKAKEEGAQAKLTLERRTAKGGGCNYELRLVNGFPYEISNLVLYYSAYRANGVIYDTVPAAAAFSFIKPGDDQVRELQFVGIGCDEIVRVQVSGGDRCVMGDLDKFSYEKGKCLARVQVVASDLVRFDK